MSQRLPGPLADSVAQVPSQAMASAPMTVELDRLGATGSRPLTAIRHSWEVEAQEVLSRAVKDPISQLKASFRKAKFPLPVKCKRRIERLEQLRRRQEESDAEDDMWSMSSWLREQDLSMVYKLPAITFLDPSGEIKGTIHQRTHVWRQAMSIRTAAHIRNIQLREGNFGQM